MAIKFIYIVSAIGCQCCITCIVFYLCSNVCEGLHNSPDDACPFIFQPSTGELIQYKTQIRSNYNSLQPKVLAVSTKKNAADAFKLICMVDLTHGCDGRPVYPCYCNHTDLHGNHHAVVMVNKTSAHSDAEIKEEVFTTDNVLIFSFTQTLSDPPEGVHMKVNGQVDNDVTVNKTSEVSITCQAGGYPEPELRISTGFKSNPKTLREMRSNTLTWATNVTCRDTGHYFCSANSTVGHLMTNVTIYVECAMELLGSTKNNSRYYGVAGGQVSVDLDVSGYPDPTSYTLMSEHEANITDGHRYLAKYTKTGMAMGTINLTLFDLKPDVFRTHYFRVDNGVADTLTFTFEVLKKTTGQSLALSSFTSDFRVNENLWVIFLIIFSVVIFMALVCLLICAFTYRNKGDSKEEVKAVSFKTDHIRSIRRVIDYPTSPRTVQQGGDTHHYQGGNAHHYAVPIVHRPASQLDCGYIDVIDDVIDERGGYSNSLPIIDGGIDP
ncbi:uncharacterized protein LOC131957251 [Physella acuta]|uniref:uncharacterized protein LOC131957251 n=1 Tax=Physella acuta TaxID=109671 RepID=UPI0027DD0EB4|nr:uncharacterized protein LOC131957251 [Physella acuta]